MAMLLLKNGHNVTLWGNFPDYVEEMREKRENVRFLPGIPLPVELRLSGSIDDVMDADVFFSAVPASFLRPVFERFASCPHDRPIVSLSKGIEAGTLNRPTEVISGVCREAHVAAFSGPSHAEEVARGLPTTVVTASSDADVAGLVQSLFTDGAFRVYTSGDVIGVEVAAAFKNVIAIAAGICDGLETGDNAKAAIFSRGLVEMSRLGMAMGGRRETFFGLAGVGDLYTTCVSRFSRNRSVGERIGRGEKLSDIIGSMDMVAEGVETTRSVMDLSSREGVEMPISCMVHDVLFNGKDPADGAKELMARAPKPEFW